MQAHHTTANPLLFLVGFVASLLNSMPTASEILHDLVLGAICGLGTFVSGIALKYGKIKLQQYLSRK